MASPVMTTNANKVCLEMEFVLPSSSLEILLLEWNPDKSIVVETVAFKTTGFGEITADWTNAKFEVPLQYSMANQIQFIFYVSVNQSSDALQTNTLVSALDNIFITVGGCISNGEKFKKKPT